MKKALLLAALLVSALGVAAVTGKPHPFVKQDDLKWVQPFGPDGPSISLVLGKFGDGKPATFFVKFTNGAQAPWHTHKHDYEGVVLKGTFTEEQAGEKVVELPAGTWFQQPSVQVHRNGCLKGDDCIVLVHFDKGADSTITTEDGKPVPPPKKDAAPAMK